MSNLQRIFLVDMFKVFHPTARKVECWSGVNVIKLFHVIYSVDCTLTCIWLGCLSKADIANLVLYDSNFRINYKDIRVCSNKASSVVL